MKSQMLPSGAVACAKPPIPAVCLHISSKSFFFSLAIPPQGDFAVVGHVEEKNDRQVDPPHNSTPDITLRCNLLCR